MIFQPFTVSSQGKRYEFIQRAALDSELLKDRITELVVENHAFSQFEAMCTQIGLREVGSIPNIRWGVFEDGDLVGIFGLGCVQYVSGPWADTVEWVVTDPEVPALFKARPMPGFLGFSAEDEDALSTAVVVHILGRESPLRTAQGTPFGFSQLEWAVLLSHTDPISLRAQRMHNAAKAHAGLKITEQLDPENSLITLVKAELA